MPTYEVRPAFERAFVRMDADRKARFYVAVRKFIEDLEAGGAIRAGLDVHPVRGSWPERRPYRFTWDEDHDGRATFHYGTDERGPYAHIVWRRIGGHLIFTDP
jgi:hypothetical protein